MSLSQATLNELQQLIVADTGLQTRLQEANDAAQAVETIVAAAAAKGLRVEPSELSAHFATATEAASAEAISDSQLESVAGGLRNGGFIAMSLFTIMAGCIINSVVHGQRKGSEEWMRCGNID